MIRTTRIIPFIAKNVRNIVTSTVCGTKNNIIKISMSSQPVNSLSLPLIKAVTNAFVEAGQDDTCKGIILNSSTRAFSAGLDLNELSNRTDDELYIFWSSFQNMLFTVYNSDKAVIAEIAGAAPAGGTMLATCCDVRIGTDKAPIGLNEAAFGLIPPYFGVDMLDDIVGKRVSWKASSLGTMFKPQDALTIGLYDIIASNEEIESISIEECEKWIKAPGRLHTKRMLHQERLTKWRAGFEEECLTFVQRVQDPRTQKMISSYLESLSMKKKK